MNQKDKLLEEVCLTQLMLMNVFRKEQKNLSINNNTIKSLSQLLFIYVLNHYLTAERNVAPK